MVDHERPLVPFETIHMPGTVFDVLAQFERPLGAMHTKTVLFRVPWPSGQDSPILLHGLNLVSLSTPDECLREKPEAHSLHVNDFVPAMGRLMRSA